MYSETGSGFRMPWQEMAWSKRHRAQTAQVCFLLAASANVVQSTATNKFVEGDLTALLNRLVRKQFGSCELQGAAAQHRVITALLGGLEGLLRCCSLFQLQ